MSRLKDIVKKKLTDITSPIVNALPQQEVSGIPFEYGDLNDRTQHMILQPAEQTATNATFQAMGGKTGVNATTGDIGELQAPNMGVSPTTGRYIGMAVGLAPSFIGGNEGGEVSSMAKNEQKFGKVLMKDEPAQKLGKVTVQEPAAERIGKTIVKDTRPEDVIQQEVQMTKNQLLPYAKKTGVANPEGIVENAANDFGDSENLLAEAGAPNRLIQRMKQGTETLVKSKARKALLD